MKKNEKKAFYLHSLNGWRGISVILVIIQHIRDQFISFNHVLFPFNLVPDYLYNHFKEVGLDGVRVFFVISGFLITSRVIQEVNKYGNFSLKEFLIKRFFRIFPPFYVYLFVLFICSFSNDVITINEILLCSIFLKYAHVPVGLNGTYTVHIWSLCLEEYFYIFQSALFFCVSNLRKIALTLGALFLTSLILLQLFYMKGYLLEAHTKAVLGRLIEIRFILLGSVIGFFEYKYSHRKLKALIQKYQTFFVGLFIITTLTTTKLKGFYYPFIVTLAIYSTSINPNKFSKVIFDNKALSKIGVWSYSIYLWQQFFLPLKGGEVSPLSFTQAYPQNIIFILIFAIVSHIAVEKPLLLFSKRFLSRRI
tara:strand:+ start:4217 stop:5308 length:1092 start_codon:yes stop_codon:yes gene_type:complete